MNVAVHDLRNPIAVIRASAQMAMRQVDRGATDAARARLEAVVQQADRLNTMLGRFLDAAYLETGHVPLRLERLDLADVVRAAAEIVQATVGERGGRSLDMRLVEGCVGGWDRQRLTRAVAALIENAYVFGDAEQPVEVRMERRNGTVALTFAGAGAGPTSEEVPHLFERFFRGHTAAEVGHAGSGLGLFTARGIARAHGGEVRQASGPDVPADAFEMELPLEP